MRFHKSFPAAFALSLLCLTPTLADVFFEEDFEVYFDDIELEADGGWLVVDENNPVETSSWTILNPGGRGNPPGEGGEPDFGQFAISDSDAQAGSNPTGSGMSHDIWSPTIEADGPSVWLHCDCLASLNNNGKAVFDVDVSTDEGETWTNVFRRVAPSRFEAEPFATIDNVGGFFGRLHVDLTDALGGETEFRVRWRHFEPSFDWWIAIDNVLVDDEAPPSGGQCNLLAPTDFASGIPEGWVVMSAIDPPNTGTETWHTTDKGDRDTREHNGGSFPYQDGHSVGRLRGPFAILDSDADPDPVEDEWLLTPVIDCGDADEVFLHFRDENDATGGEEVLLSLDGGVTFEPVPIFSYGLGAGYDTGEEPFYGDRVFSVPLATAESEVVFAFHYSSGGNQWWWAIDDVGVSATLIGGSECPCNCTTRGFSAGEFDATDGSVSLAWSGCDDDATHRVLRNGEVISGDLGGDVTSFVDVSPQANVTCPFDPESEEVWAVYTLESVDAEGAELTNCGPVCVEARSCPKNLSCCYDEESGEVTMSWVPGIGVDGVSWRIRRNGVPRSSLALDSDTYSETAPSTPGTYEYTLELNGGNPQQCPNLPLRCTLVIPGSEILLFDDFECYASTEEVVAAGWQMILTNEPAADGSQWQLGNGDTSNPLGNPCARGNPPTADGTPSQGKFLISDNDCGGFTATQGSGQSYDLISPTFDASDSAIVWLHVDCTAVLNNNGEVVVDIDVSADGGKSWTNLLRRVGAARGAVEPFPLADIPDDVAGGPQVGNADGIFGRIHLDLSDVAAGEGEVTFRVRHFEPSFDWWVAIDNVVVDSSPVLGGNLTLLEPEGFDDEDLPEGWEAESIEVDGFAPWRTSDPCGLSLLNSNGGLFPDGADGRQLHHFDEKFAHVFGDTKFCGASVQNELLITPSIDATGADNVYLHVRSAIVFLSADAEIVVSLDGGGTFDFDNPIFSYSRGGGFHRADGNAEVAYGEYIIEVPRAAGEADVVFAFHYDNPGGIGGWWAIDDVSITADGDGAEHCSNGRDDDGDDLVDCDDPDCRGDVEACPPTDGFVRGDSNSSSVVDLTDGVVTLNFLFTGGPAPPCLDAADTDDNGALVISDAVVIFSYLFTGGPAPVDPAPSATNYQADDCGPDINEDQLDCAVRAATCE